MLPDCCWTPVDSYQAAKIFKNESKGITSNRDENLVCKTTTVNKVKPMKLTCLLAKVFHKTFHNSKKCSSRPHTRLQA